MPRDALRNPLVLPLIGMLVERPGHAYELTRRLTERYPNLAVRRSSITTLLGSLVTAGLVDPGDPEREGGRPQRRPYRLTTSGLRELGHRVRAGIEHAEPGSSDLQYALAYLGALSPTDAVEVLTRRRDRIRADADRLRDHLAELPGSAPTAPPIDRQGPEPTATGDPDGPAWTLTALAWSGVLDPDTALQAYPAHLAGPAGRIPRSTRRMIVIEIEYWLDLLRGEGRWLTALIADIADDLVRWPVDDPAVRDRPVDAIA